MKIIGIDLGTSNTYLYGIKDLSLDINSVPVPVIIPKLTDSQGSMATVVMYEDGKAVLAGNIAESEFYSNLSAGSRRFLESQFKPEIAQRDDRAMRAMTDFLRLMRIAMPKGVLEEDTRVYAGIPSLSREDFSINLSDCFMNAGWPKPYFAHESDAALVSCLQSNVVNMGDLQKNCLILDFGGGTCDYTAIADLEAIQNGGDPLYGGRLFDDLIYQIFCQHDELFAREAPNSPYSWYVHWIECKTQKENFSNFLAQKDSQDKSYTLRLVWYDQKAQRHEAFIRDYTRDAFIQAAENFKGTPELLKILKPYQSRGGLSAHARDLLAGMQIGLISWLKAILETASQRGALARVILTGGSARWFFVPELTARLFPAAVCVHSQRNFEDIAFGLALFPLLKETQSRTQKLLNQDLPQFSKKLSRLAQTIIHRQVIKIANQCAERIVERDVMPALEKAQHDKMTVAELENAFENNIREDTGLIDIVRRESQKLRADVQKDLNSAFRAWLSKNEIMLVPEFQFPIQEVEDNFFENVSVKISRLDSLNLMGFTLTKILPVLAGMATAGVVAHSAEPISTILAGSAAFGGTWLLARTAPSLLEKRPLPSFLLTDKNRKRIIEKNRAYIDRVLTESLLATENDLISNLDNQLEQALKTMLAKLTILNQVVTH